MISRGADLLNRRRGPPRACRIPGAALAVFTFLWPTVIVSCNPRDEPAVTPVDSTSASAALADSGSGTTPRALAALSAALEVPVQGITRAQLRDTYYESRGDHVHEALDIQAPRGTPVLSATDGRLLKLFQGKAGGLMVYATDASERFILFYGHLDSYAPDVSEGMRLQRGQTIGYVGTTGNAPAGTPHLHFGILRGDPQVSWSRGVPVNPYSLLVRAKDQVTPAPSKLRSGNPSPAG